MYLRPILASVALVLQAGASISFAEEPSIEIQALDCRFALPPGFVLNTREKSHFTLYTSSLSDLGRINIRETDGTFDRSSYRVEHSRIEGHLEIRTLVALEESEFGYFRMTEILHDGQSVQLISQARELEDDIVRDCLDSHPPRRRITSP